ncbi:MAG: BolA family protein, partial [Thiohalorhabdaceae bacterium]
PGNEGRKRAMDVETVKSQIQAEMPDAEVNVQGDGRHFQALVVSSEFEGMPKVKQHRRVYACFGEELGDELHALELKTFTPEQYQAMVEANNPS